MSRQNTLQKINADEGLNPTEKFLLTSIVMTLRAINASHDQERLLSLQLLIQQIVLLPPQLASTFNIPSIGMEEGVNVHREFQDAYRNASIAHKLAESFVSKGLGGNENLQVATFHQARIVHDNLPFLMAYVERFGSEQSRVNAEQSNSIVAMQTLLRGQVVSGLLTQKSLPPGYEDFIPNFTVFKDQAPISLLSSVPPTVQPTSQFEQFPLHSEDSSTPLSSSVPATTNTSHQQLLPQPQPRQSRYISGSSSSLSEQLKNQRRQIDEPTTTTILVDEKLQRMSAADHATALRKLFVEDLKESKNKAEVWQVIQTHLAFVIELKRNSTDQGIESVFKQDIEETVTLEQEYDFLQGLYYFNKDANAIIPALQLSATEMDEKSPRNFLVMAKERTCRSSHSFNDFLLNAENGNALLPQVVNIAKQENLSAHTVSLGYVARMCYQLEVAYWSFGMRDQRKNADYTALTTIRSFLNQKAVYDLIHDQLSEKEQGIFFERGLSSDKQKPKNRAAAEKQAEQFLKKNKRSDLVLAAAPTLEKEKSASITDSLLSFAPEFNILRNKKKEKEQALVTEVTTSTSSQSSLPQPQPNSSVPTNTLQQESTINLSSSSSSATTSSRRSSSFRLSLPPQPTTVSTPTSQPIKVALDEHAIAYDTAYEALGRAFNDAKQTAHSTFKAANGRTEFVRAERYKALIDRFNEFTNLTENRGNWDVVKGEDAVLDRSQNANNVKQFIDEQTSAAMAKAGEIVLSEKRKMTGVVITDTNLKTQNRSFEKTTGPMNMALIARYELINSFQLDKKKPPQKEQFVDAAITLACQIDFLDHAARYVDGFADAKNIHSTDKKGPTNAQSLERMKVYLTSFQETLANLPQVKPLISAAKPHLYAGVFEPIADRLYIDSSKLRDINFLKTIFQLEDEHEQENLSELEETKAQRLLDKEILPTLSEEGGMNNPKQAFGVYKALAYLANSPDLLQGPVRFENQELPWLGKNGLLTFLAHHVLSPSAVRDFVTEYNQLPPQSVFELAGIDVVQNTQKNGYQYTHTTPANESQEAKTEVVLVGRLQPTPDRDMFPDLFEAEEKKEEKKLLSSSSATKPLVPPAKAVSTPPPIPTKSPVVKQSFQLPQPPKKKLSAPVAVVPDGFKLTVDSELTALLFKVKTAFESKATNLLELVGQLHELYNRILTAYEVKFSENTQGVDKYKEDLSSSLDVIEAFLTQQELRTHIYTLGYKKSLPAVREENTEVYDLEGMSRILNSTQAFGGKLIVTAPVSAENKGEGESLIDLEEEELLSNLSLQPQSLPKEQEKKGSSANPFLLNTSSFGIGKKQQTGEVSTPPPQPQSSSIYNIFSSPQSTTQKSPSTSSSTQKSQEEREDIFGENSPGLIGENLVIAEELTLPPKLPPKTTALPPPANASQLDSSSGLFSNNPPPPPTEESPVASSGTNTSSSTVTTTHDEEKTGLTEDTSGHGFG